MVIISSTALIQEFQNLLNNMWIHIFIWFVIFDIGTGISKGFINKQSNSTKGLTGLIKHLVVVMLVIISVPYLTLAGFSNISTWFIVFYIAVYGISIIENLGQIGIPLPKWVKNLFDKLKDSTDEGPKTK